MRGSQAGARVLVVDDDSIVRSWIRLSLEGSEFRVVGEARSAAEAYELAARHRADLLLVDLRLGDGAGTELVRALRRSGLATPALIMTANSERGLNEAAREAGAQGTVLKTGQNDDLVEALRRIAAGATSFDPRHPRREPGRAPVTPRERQVLRLVASGATNAQIAAELGVGQETVKTLLARACTKLGVSRRAEAVHAAHERGLL